MVRGTYFPWPRTCRFSQIFLSLCVTITPTSFREKGTETLIRIGSFALFGEIAVRLGYEELISFEGISMIFMSMGDAYLDAMFKAIELGKILAFYQVCRSK